jgi:pimeloyl-ACP methyl ester carboxylesterase
MLSGPVGPRAELFLNTLRSHLRSNGKSPAQVEQVISAVEGWMEARSQRARGDEIAHLRRASVDAFAAVGFPMDTSEAFVSTLDNPVVLSMFEASTDTTLAAVRVPVLVIYGSQDTILAPGLVPAAVAALEANPDGLVVTVPGMTHELQRAKPDPAAAPVKDSTMAVVTETLGAWLAHRLRTSQF